LSKIQDIRNAATAAITEAQGDILSTAGCFMKAAAPFAANPATKADVSSLCAPGRHPHARNEPLQTGGHHGRCLCALGRHPHAQHELLPPGGHHRRCLCAPGRPASTRCT
jgi:hypothetical protein